MNCKKRCYFWILSAIIGLSFISCSNEDAVSLRVHISTPSKSTLTVSKLTFNGMQTVDSVKIRSGQSVKRFILEQGKEPEFYALSFKGYGSITLLAKQGEEIDVNVDLENLSNYTVSGSDESQKVKQLTDLFIASKRRVDQLSNKYLTATTDIERKSANEAFKAEIDTLRNKISKFIWANPMSKASIMALYLKYNDNIYLFDRSEDLTLIKMVASAWRALYPESSYTTGMLEDIKRIEGLIRNVKMKQLIANAQFSIPDLIIPDKTGKPIKLSSLKGKVILLDFFSVNNTTSLLDNRELMEIYKAFSPKGFEVYQVSLDPGKEEWVSYIENNKIPWISVREEDPTASQAALTYNIRQLPSNYLINRNMEIIGKNLYGNQLKKKLSQVLTK